MKVRLGRFIALTFALVALAASGAAQDEATRYEELPNFHRVNAQLYRGAQPKPGGLERLAALGVKTIINLRDDDEHARDEGEAARAWRQPGALPHPKRGRSGGF